MAVSTPTVAIAIEPACAALANAANLRAVIARTLAAEGVREPVSLSVVLVDDATIHELNRRFLDHDEPTDVITFALDDALDSEAGADGFVNPSPHTLGEIYVSCERAAAQAAEWGNDPTREVRFLVIHGVLHLLGWDDATPADRQRMLDRQEAILRGATSGGDR